MDFEPDLPPWMDARRAAKIAQLRALGMTQVQIADTLGISQQTVSRYVRGIKQAAGEADSKEDFLMGLLVLGLGAAALFALFKALQGGQPPRL